MTTLKQRSRQPEDMDDPGLHFEHYAHALNGLSHLNFAAGTAQVFWHRLRQIVRTRPAATWRLLDVATGGGDIPLRIWRLAQADRLSIRISGCDVSKRAVTLAQQRAHAAGADITFFPQDVVHEEFPGEYDFVICSLFLHHLSEGDSVTVLRRLSRITRERLLISDLRRCALGLATAFVATHMFTTSPVARTDGLRSVRAAYTIPEVRALATDAGLPLARIARHWPSRWLLCWSPQ